MGKIEKFLTKYPFLTIVLLSLPSVWALFSPGYFGVSDDLHIGWLHQMDKIVKEGQIPPRFVPDLSYGFGYPLFNFVFPLPFYIAELFHLAGLSLVNSIKTVFILSLPVSGYFMYRLLRQFTKPLLALAGGLIYMYAPYRATEVFVRGAVGEALAFVFLPLVILSVIKASKNENKAWVATLGITVALLITSHNITAIMFFPFLLLFIAIWIFSLSPPRPPAFIRIFSGLFLGLLTSSYFWLPALVESSLMKKDTVFNYFDHFPTLKQLVTPYFGYGASVPGPYDGISFFIGSAGLLVIAVSLIAFLNRKKLEKERIVLVFWTILVFLASVFMMNHRSSFLWDSIPFIQYFQFPWRFLILVVFTIPLFVVLIDKYKYKNYLAILISILAIALNFSYFRPSEFLGRQDAYYINRYIPYPEASEEYKMTSEEYLRLPKETYTRPSAVPARIEFESGQVTEVNYLNSLDAQFKVVSEVTSLVNYNKYYFPGWSARVDGEPVILSSGVPYGQIIFELEEGEHNIEVFFRETPFRTALNWVSLFSLLSSLYIVFKFRK